MGKVFRSGSRETSLLSKIESSKERNRRQRVKNIKECMEQLSNAVAMKLIENNLIETSNKNGVEEQLMKSLEKLSHADDFDIDYQTAPIRTIVPQPHVVSLYLTAFVIEQLIKYKDVVDIFGSDEEIYFCINKQVTKFIP